MSAPPTDNRCRRGFAPSSNVSSLVSTWYWGTSPPSRRRGDRQVCRFIRVPSVAEEDARRSHRELARRSCRRSGWTPLRR
jgi:hypothetical protein